MYLQNLKVGKLTEPELQKMFYDYSKQEITFVESFFCGVDVRSRHFEKNFCHVRNADIQDYAPARNVTHVVIFRMSKDCHSELVNFGRRTPLVAEAR